MRKYYYDLHLHSCLSACADNDQTPFNIAGMAKISGLDIVALTDHNTTANCPAFFRACEEYGLVAIGGMELTTSEDIHVVCLFPTLEDTMAYGKEIDAHRTKIKNRKEIFGEQYLIDENDEVIGEDPYLLSVATDISIEDVCDYVSRHNGICFPAHIDRDSYSATTVLGVFPLHLPFSLFELHDGGREEEFRTQYGLGNKKMICSSDAHTLEDIRDGEYYILLDDLDEAQAIREALFREIR